MVYLKVALSSVRFYEKEDVPEDAQVVRHADRRSGRSRMPVVLYGLVQITLPRKLEVSLQVSSRDAAARFARVFGARETGKATEGSSYKEEHPEGGTAAFNSLSLEERAKAASACRTLGVRADASMSEISAAYKQLARIHHPDKVANLPEEDREASERQMKEINAAYTELRRLNRNSTGGARAQ